METAKKGEAVRSPGALGPRLPWGGCWPAGPRARPRRGWAQALLLGCSPTRHRASEPRFCCPGDGRLWPHRQGAAGSQLRNTQLVRMGRADGSPQGQCVLALETEPQTWTRAPRGPRRWGRGVRLSPTQLLRHEEASAHSRGPLGPSPPGPVACLWASVSPSVGWDGCLGPALSGAPQSLETLKPTPPSSEPSTVASEPHLPMRPPSGPRGVGLVSVPGLLTDPRSRGRVSPAPGCVRWPGAGSARPHHPGPAADIRFLCAQSSVVTQMREQTAFLAKEPGAQGQACTRPAGPSASPRTGAARFLLRAEALFSLAPRVANGGLWVMSLVGGARVLSAP